MFQPAPALLLLISAPSGGGKTTLCTNLLEAHPEIHRAITCTTRPPRLGEEPGRDYHFLEPDDFERRVEAGQFLEHASVYGRRYGVLKADVLDPLRAGRDVLLNIDVQGAATIRDQAGRDPELGGALVSVFLAPPNMEELERRLRGRESDPEEEIERRLGEARRELKEARHFHYILVSGTREEDLQRLESILAAERMREGRVWLSFGAGGAG